MGETLNQVHIERTVAVSELEKLRFRAETLEEKNSSSWVDLSLQTTWQREAREELNDPVAELKEVQLRLEVWEAGLISKHEVQTSLAFVLEQLC